MPDRADPSRSLTHLESEFPGATRVPVKRMSLLQRGLGKLAPLIGGEEPVAAAGLLGSSILVNPNAMPTSQDELDDVMAHELTHIQQRKRMGLPRYLFEQKVRPWLAPYAERPLEQEAMQVEIDRSLRPSRHRGDIHLPSASSTPAMRGLMASAQRK